LPPKHLVAAARARPYGAACCADAAPLAEPGGLEPAWKRLARRSRARRLCLATRKDGKAASRVWGAPLADRSPTAGGRSSYSSPRLTLSALNRAKGRGGLGDRHQVAEGVHERAVVLVARLAAAMPVRVHAKDGNPAARQLGVHCASAGAVSGPASSLRLCTCEALRARRLDCASLQPEQAPRPLVQSSLAQRSACASARDRRKGSQHSQRAGAGRLAHRSGSDQCARHSRAGRRAARAGGAPPAGTRPCAGAGRACSGACPG